MKVTIGALVVAAGLTALAFHSRGWAQAPRPSQHGSVSQQIANTTITIEYNRPVARGRMLFGSVVPYGRVWCPGADNCTTIQVSTDVKVNGQALGRGTYSVWAEPNQDRWTMILNSATAGVSHTLPTGQRRSAPAGHAAAGLAHGDAGVLFPSGRRQPRGTGLALGHGCRASLD